MQFSLSRNVNEQIKHCFLKSICSRTIKIFDSSLEVNLFLLYKWNTSLKHLLLYYVFLFLHIEIQFLFWHILGGFWNSILTCDCETFKRWTKLYYCTFLFILCATIILDLSDYIVIYTLKYLYPAFLQTTVMMTYVSQSPLNV